jgi:hypothetical protein
MIKVLIICLSKLKMESSILTKDSEISELITKYSDYLCIKENQNLLLKDKIFSEDFLKQLKINATNHTDKENNFYKNYDDNFIFKSYPRGNYLSIILYNLNLCIQKKFFPFEFFNISGYKDMTKQNIENIKLDIQLENIYDVFNSLKERGLLTLLGIRQTPGSLNYIPPDVNLFIDKFKELHSKEVIIKNTKAKPSILTVGARALSKHTHRSSEGFWPTSEGKEVDKNKKAEELLNKFIEECVWINIHGLPGDIPIVELRTEEGYGIRWQVDGVFRGFLEPHMEDGHSKGWKH